ncbi:MAG: mechanosensitive ion channel [Actinobacteria bacterium]|nr:mechanosensitive ion channel [Actinomycetota bacterium]
MSEETWQQLAVAGGMIVVAFFAARLVDRALMRRLELPPEALTRYRVLRRSVTATIVALGILSALLVIPQVRAVAGGVLASGAVAGLVIGMAARSTLANFVAGVLVAVTQPLRLGDDVEVGDAAGTVEEIALTYTTLRSAEGARFFIPNELLASDTIRNATIGGAEQLMQVSIPVPLAADLNRVVSLVEEEARVATSPSEKQPTAQVTDFEAQAQTAVVTVDAWAPRGEVGLAASALRLAVHRRLRAEGIL